VAPFCHQVIAVDISPLMLDALRQQAANASINNIEVVQAGFLSYEHQGEPVDFVYSRHALHHLPDFWKALALNHISAIMKPGGILYIRDLIFSCAPDETEQVVEQWLANASTHPDKGWTHTELETHLREEYSTFSWLLEPMIEQAGFEIQKADHSDSKIYSVYLCIKN
jgi:SAM-dependent methyltransferase